MAKRESEEEKNTAREAKEKAFGDIALARGIVDKITLVTYHKRRAKLIKAGKRMRLGELMMADGLLNKEAALDILKEATIQVGVNLKIGGYEILGKLGEGAMGAVYRARQITMDRLVALKLLPRRLSKDASFVKKFMREAQTCARLNHLNIVQAIDIGSGSGYHYFAMEYIHGKTLERVLKKTPVMKESQTISFALQVVEGLAHAAKHNITHRDIKPANIMICKDGTVKIMDMGLALVTEHQTSAGKIDRSDVGVPVGTPYYMAPEQAEGKSDIDFRADIYALGATMFEMCTGEKPWQGDSITAIMAKRLMDPPPVTIEVNPETSQALSDTILQMMAQDPDERYLDFDDLRSDLQAAAGSAPNNAKSVARRLPTKLSMSAGDNAKPRRRTTSRRRALTSRKMIFMGLGALAAGLVVLLLVVFLLASSAPAHPHPQRSKITDWSPITYQQTPGEKAHALWVKARNAYHDYERSGKTDASLRTAAGKAYQKLAEQYPDCAYASRANALATHLAPE